MENSKKNQLKGRENFLAWSTRLETLLLLDEVIKRNENTDKLEIAGTSDKKVANEKTAKKYIIQNCDDCVMHTINPAESFVKIFAKLNTSYGFGNMDPSIILNQLRDIRFHPSKNPSHRLLLYQYLNLTLLFQILLCIQKTRIIHQTLHLLFIKKSHS